ncbi:hypothetical protein GTY84_07740 [Streptomyces sp. SID8352]|nr:hypothetical protein [Streptomyces sp. SID8352]
MLPLRSRRRLAPAVPVVLSPTASLGLPPAGAGIVARGPRRRKAAPCRTSARRVGRAAAAARHAARGRRRAEGFHGPGTAGPRAVR